MSQNHKAFTLMEMLVTVALLGVIAAFAVPSYNKSVQRADEKQAVTNLRLMSEALELYKVHNGDYPDFDMPQISDINTTLNLGIIEQNLDYQCYVDVVEGYACEAVSSYGWEIHGEKGTDLGDPHCSVASCPTCPAVGCAY